MKGVPINPYSMEVGVYDKELMKIYSRDGQSLISAQTWYEDLYFHRIGIAVVWFNSDGAIIGAQISPFDKIDVQQIINAVIAAGAKKIIVNYNAAGAINKYDMCDEIQKGLKSRDIKIVRFYVVENGMIDRVMPLK